MIVKSLTFAEKREIPSDQSHDKKNKHHKKSFIDVRQLGRLQSISVGISLAKYIFSTETKYANPSQKCLPT